MLFSALAVVSIFWLITIVLTVAYSRGWICVSRPGIVHLYDELPVIYDNCTGFTAKHIYLLRIIYGDRNRKFFFPNANITVRMFDSNGRKLSWIQIKSEILVANHRRYLMPGMRKKPKLLYVLIKTACELNNVQQMTVEHNIPGAIIFFYDVYLLDLQNHVMRAAKIYKTIHCLSQGLSLDKQKFLLPELGKCKESVGPSTNFTMVQMFCVFVFGVSTLLIFTSTYIECKETVLVCRLFTNLANAYATSLVASAVALSLSILILSLDRFCIRPINAKTKNLGFVWMIYRIVPFFLGAYVFITGVLTMVALMSPMKYQEIEERQRLFWVITFVLSTSIYTLALILLIQLAYLYNMFTSARVPLIKLESPQIEASPKPQSQKTDSQLKAYLSTANLALSSSIIEKSKISSKLSEAESISKVIETTYEQRK